MHFKIEFFKFISNEGQPLATESKKEFILSGIKKTPESNNGLPSPSEDYDTFKNLADVGAVLGYGRTRFYQWCRGRGFLTPMNVPSHEMISSGYMVMVLSDSGHTRVYVTPEGFNYVSGAFAVDIQRGMVKF